MHPDKYFLLIICFISMVSLYAQSPGPTVPKKATAKITPSSSSINTGKPTQAKKTIVAPDANRKYRGNLNFSKWDCSANYTGDIEYQKPNGYGTFIFISGVRSGDVFEGNFTSGFFNGQGTYTYVSGDKYVGEWKDDKKNGLGKYYDKNSLLDYEGQYKDGERINK